MRVSGNHKFYTIEAYQIGNEIEGYHEQEYHYDQSLNW